VYLVLNGAKQVTAQFVKESRQQHIQPVIEICFVGENELVQGVQEQTEHLYRMCMSICYMSHIKMLFTYLNNSMVHNLSQRPNSIVILKDQFLGTFTNQTVTTKVDQKVRLQ
jgi:hypothetical protein